MSNLFKSDSILSELDQDEVLKNKKQVYCQICKNLYDNGVLKEKNICVCESMKLLFKNF